VNLTHPFTQDKKYFGAAIVGIYGTRAFICGHNDAATFTDKDALVVCRTLGKTHGVKHNMFYRSRNDGGIYAVSLRCTGSEKSLLECPGGKLDLPTTLQKDCITKDLNYYKTASVTCYNEDTTEGMYLLVHVVKKKKISHYFIIYKFVVRNPIKQDREYHFHSWNKMQ
jgi:hypothetical protein